MFRHGLLVRVKNMADDRRYQTIYEYACHEGNRAVTGILGGARHVELHGDGAGQ